VRDWVEERFLFALEEFVPISRYSNLHCRMEEVMVPCSIAYYVYQLHNHYLYSFIRVRGSSGVFTLYAWYNDGYDHPDVAVDNWIFDLYRWYYADSILALDYD